MRVHYLISFLGVLLCGCGHHQQLSAPVTSDSKALTDQSAATLFGGSWDLSFPDGLQNVRIEMQQSGRWRLWSPSGQPDPTATIQAGTWFIRQKILFLRVEERTLGHWPLGLAYTFDVLSVSKDAALLTWLDGKREVKWTRARTTP